ncbi:hypothetical protein DL766_000516 [Monosporascus sp. MC13-8B]|uniref:AB hydrolase-1 domain-containing protein n=1 Tax=Monosporascus cannonballus TaxID=155416 RepID=A0ABY0GUI5_9PEZI|nr:hypothetical protein DL762_010464 [Monosporascus cannonballus]RYO76419.1 hypothetical protein DL763_010497 [Monosporascus cannonballus]RYP39258.1 hypothetical protein DL766_000516 [Monosporascus sp. MC13-8B]
MHNLRTLLLLTTVAGTNAQATVAPQSTGFNSSFALSRAQIEKASLSEDMAASLNTVINFDRSQLANGGPREDAFYLLPPLSPNTTGPPPSGTPLRAQRFTDPAPFAIPPNTALSRILYTTTNTNGTVVPASAFVLWPFEARRFPGPGSGYSPAPSTHRALWYADAALFTLAQAGYAVVGSDYAGLGVSESWDGSAIPHEYLVSSAGARDALNALRAAREAFAELLEPRFVAMGHSQGVAEALASDEFADLAGGYLGTIAASPTTDVFGGLPEFIVSWIGMMLDSIFPDFELSQWLTPLGVARTELLREVEGGIAVGQQLYFTGEAIVREDYRDTWYADAYAKLANVGRKPFRGPLLVVQGTEDVYIPFDITSATVRDTCEVNPENDLEYLVINGTQHVPTMHATRQTWLRWIEDRFEARPLAKSGCVRSDLESFLPAEQYQSTGKSFPQWAGAPEYSYEIPLGL